MLFCLGIARNHKVHWCISPLNASANDFLLVNWGQNDFVRANIPHQGYIHNQILGSRWSYWVASLLSSTRIHPYDQWFLRYQFFSRHQKNWPQKANFAQNVEILILSVSPYMAKTENSVDGWSARKTTPPLLSGTLVSVSPIVLPLAKTGEQFCFQYLPEQLKVQQISKMIPSLHISNMFAHEVEDIVCPWFADS